MLQLWQYSASLDKVIYIKSEWKLADGFVMKSDKISPDRT